MRKKQGLLAGLTARLDIPGEALPGGFGVELSGQRELTVRGCRRILHYGDEEIRLRVGKTVLCVCGKELLCTSFGNGGVTVRGWIVSLRFGEAEG